MTETLPARRINPAGTKLTRSQLQIVKNTIAKNASNEELAFFVNVCERTGLNPLARQIHFVRVWDSSVSAMVGVPVVGIDGLRLIAERTGEYDGQGEPEWYDAETGTWSEVWIGSRPPDAARVKVYRKGVSHPFVGIAMWTEYVQTKRDGSITSMWKAGSGKPAHMLAKCAEALGLRKGFPNELSGIYTEEELGKSIPTDAASADEIDRRADLELLRCVVEIAAEHGVEAWGERAVVHQARASFGREEIDSLDALTVEEVEKVLAAVPPGLMHHAEERLAAKQAEGQDGHGAVIEGEVVDEPTPAIAAPSNEPGLAEQVAAAQETREPVEARPAAEEPGEEPAAAQEPGQAPTELFPTGADDIPWEGEAPHQGPGAYDGEPGQS